MYHNVDLRSFGLIGARVAMQIGRGGRCMFGWELMTRSKSLNIIEKYAQSGKQGKTRSVTWRARH